jgi:hypothetical protein
MRRILAISASIIALLIGLGIYQYLSNRAETAQTLTRLYLGKPCPKSLRQLDILKNVPDNPVSSKYIPVQIFARPDERYRWEWFGMGAIIDGKPYLATAAHVMQAFNNIQYGYRVISKKVLEEDVAILPILNCDTLSTPIDVALCKIALQPVQSKPLSFVVKKERYFANGKLPPGMTFVKKVGELTLIANGEKIPTSFLAVIGSSTLVLWQSKSMTAGESGSIAMYVDKSGLTAPVMLHGSIWLDDGFAERLGLEKGSSLVYGSLLNF